MLQVFLRRSKATNNITAALAIAELDLVHQLLCDSESSNRRGFNSSCAYGSSTTLWPHQDYTRFYIQDQQRRIHGSTTSSTPSTTPHSSRLLNALPTSWVPYARLSRIDKPTGTWLLAWPCFWSIALAADPGCLPDMRLLALFGAGAFLLRGAGCTVNDLWDQELDRKVGRTRNRPLASRQVTTLQATGWLAAQLSAGLGVLLQLNPYSQILGASSLALVASYPLMKRITGWPQAFLGLTINWGALMGWAAARGACDWTVVLPLYISGVCWTLVYDTIYAHQDKVDDMTVGIRSTALTFGARNKQYLTGFSATSIACLAVAGHMGGCGAPFYAAVTAAAAHLSWQVATVDLDDPEDCALKFASNTWYGALVSGGIVVDRLLGIY
jgi:4-hydroxybenzoate polyprenyltransferase